MEQEQSRQIGQDEDVVIALKAGNISAYLQIIRNNTKANNLNESKILLSLESLFLNAQVASMYVAGYSKAHALKDKK